MLKDRIAADFNRDPLNYLDLAGSPDIVQTGPNEYCLGNPVDARDVLRNAEGRYREHSDFFHTRHGLFGPPQAQLKIRREARTLMRTYLQANKETLPAFLAAHLPAVSEWPDTGNRLAYRYLLPALLAPDSPPKLRRLLDEIVECSVLAGAKARQPRWRRMWLQFNTTLQLSNAIEARRALARPQPMDLLDVVACSGEHGQQLDELVEVYLSFVFAVAGSVGFVLAWSLYLLGTHPRRDVPPEWIVQEALRLWPVAWQLGRRPAVEHEVSGVQVDTKDELVVCPYFVHRHPDYWNEPGAFRPERWADPEAWNNPAFIPFGHGPHRCVAADLSPQLVGDIIGILLGSNTVAVTPHDTRPTIAAAMAPPRFSLALQRNP